MENSVIISSIKRRVEYYASAAGITSNVIKKYILFQITSLEKDITQPQLINIKRLLQGFDLAMGEKRTTEKMYLERDLKYLEEMDERLFPVDKNKGRNFVNTMRQGQDVLYANELDNNGTNIAKSKTLTKVNRDSNAYNLYSNSGNAA